MAIPALKKTFFNNLFVVLNNGIRYCMSIHVVPKAYQTVSVRISFTQG